jgi:hypothetical protein
MLQRGQGPYGSDEQRAFVPLSSLLIRLATISTLTLTITIAAVLPGGAQVPAKKTVASAADLPRFTYPLAIAPSVLIQSDAPVFDAFAAKVLTDIDGVLAGYDIEDHATLRGLLEEQLELQLLSGTEDAAALSTADQMRALVDKPDAKLLSGLSVRATVAARTQTHATAGDAYLAAFGAHFSAALAPLPWPVVGSALKELKTTYELLTPALLVGQVAGTIDPAAAQSHSVSGETAATIIRMRYYVNIFLPQRVPAVAALSALIAQHTVQKPDIWTAREVTLGAADKLTPVRIAVWDSGSDVTLFPKQLYTDLAPAAADPHGLAFDLLGFKTHGDLYPLTPEQRASYPAAVKFLAGYSDLQESIDSPAAAEMKQQVAALAPAAVTPYFQNLNLMSIYSHGTHVAGIALRGNPAARLVVARVTFDYRSIPLPLTEELARREAGNYQKYVDYFRAHHVRVVNMSWGGTPAGIEDGLEKNNLGKDAGERKTMAANLFAIERAGMYAALKSAPEILFVCAAGNGDSNNGFEQVIPASLELPNLLVAGAVDQAGDETSFTSYGKTVLVDADGYQVESYVPGGTRLRLSGTSMAAPNVANLAGKLIALKPALTPVQTIALIRAGATTTSDGRRHNIDPKRSVALLRQRR